MRPEGRYGYAPQAPLNPVLVGINVSKLPTSIKLSGCVASRTMQPSE